LALALKEGFDCLALSFDYGQRHKVELEYAKELCTHFQVEQRIIRIDPAGLGRSALSYDMDVPALEGVEQARDSAVPPTYVPARNTLFLAYAMVQAELEAAQAIFFGPNADDAGYPDCSPAYVTAYGQLIHLATKQAREGQAPELRTPLIAWDKLRIAQEAVALDVPVEKTWSCYSPQVSDSGVATPCGCCAACLLRADAFAKIALV
jgi:7-cyano-7-deazaguanine synthase